METDYVASLGQAIEAVNVHPKGSFTWFGELHGVLPRRLRVSVSDDVAAKYAIEVLGRHLYRNYYSTGYATTSRQESAAPITMGVTPFLAALIDANTGDGFIDPRWDIEVDSADGEIVARLGGLTIWPGPEDLQTTPGSSAEGLRLQKHFLERSPGYYVALSNKWFDPDTPTVVRVYWNQEPFEAPQFVRALTTLLNAAGVPFQLKVLKDPSSYYRCDATVLYLCRSDLEGVLREIAPLRMRQITASRTLVPAMTKPILPGVALAEDPGNGDSFGMHRCRIIATSLFGSRNRRDRTQSDEIDAVGDAFASVGLSLETPYLGPGAEDFDITATLPRSRARSSSRPPPSYLEQAHRIARHLVDEAVWFGDQCNWIGDLPTNSVSDGQAGVASAALGADLYNGSSGIGLFLSETAQLTADREIAQTALGALRHALGAPIPRTADYWGLFTGWPGVALASARAAVALGSEEIRNRARLFAAANITAPTDGAPSDLMGGLSGAICALQVFSLCIELPGVDDLIVRLGDSLLDVANVTEFGLSWGSIDAERDLTGLAHGASGVGLALADLHRTTDLERFRSAAESAFSYERNWYDADRRNWRDFRYPPGQARRGAGTVKFATTWCHGAPGIGLSRFASNDVLTDPECTFDALAAADTTRTAIRTGLLTGMRDLSLCHGLTGLAEVLKYADARGFGHQDDSELIDSVAKYGGEKYSDPQRDWQGGPRTPGMMLGLSGIGNFYLRMHDDRIPSPTVVIDRRGTGSN